MAFVKENFNVARKVALGKGELTVECNVSCGAVVSKVLSLSVEGYVQNAETQNGVVNFAGAVDCKLVIMDEEGGINSVLSSCPFSSKFDCAEAMPGQDAFVKVKVIDSSIESVGGDMIKIAAVLEQSGEIVANFEVATVACNDDDVCVKSEEMAVKKYIGCALSDASVESEINLRENIKKILLTESQCVVKSVDAGAGFASVSGDIVTRVLYLSENDKFESGYINDTFKEEIELADASRESYIEGNAYVKSDGVTSEIIQDEKGGKIVVKVPLTISVRGFEDSQVSVIKDLYSTKNELQVTTESYSETVVHPIECVEGKIEGSLTLEDNLPRVDKLCFNGGNSIAVTNCYHKDGEVYVEGIAKTTAVYLNDEDSSLHSVQLDVPFVLSDKCNFEEEGRLQVDIIVNDVDVVVKKGREFYYDAKVKACVSFTSERSGGVISDVVTAGEYSEKDYAMEVIFAPKGEELWEVAKSAKVKEEQLSRQNPEVVFPVQEDTPLVLFYQRLQ